MDPRFVDLQWSIRIIARHILASAARNVEWEDYPDIGELDWEEVCRAADGMANEPSGEDFALAYSYLTERADS